MKSILDPAFRYVPSASTNLHKTFARIRRELRQQREREVAKLAPSVVPFAKPKAGA